MEINVEKVFVKDKTVFILEYRKMKQIVLN